MGEALADDLVPVRKTRRCVNCGEQFVPWESGQRYCGNSPECNREERNAEREAYEERRMFAQEDDYGRY